MATRATIRGEAAALPEEGTSLAAKWVIALFFVTLFIPGSFFIGVRMTPYRLFLLLMAGPMLIRFFRDPTIRLNAVDLLVFVAIFWRSLAIVVNHQMSEIANAGSSFIELFFGYLLGRVYVRKPADYRFFFGCFFVTLLAFLPFALLEFATRRRVLRTIFAVALTQPAETYGDQIRFGFMRVQVSFDHAILFGNFCAIGFANLFYIHRDKFLGRFGRMGFVAGMALLSISSSSMLTLALQSTMIAYDRVLKPFRKKWVVLGVTIAVLWFSFEALVGKSVPDYVTSELVINEYGGTARIDQVVYGLREIYGNPFFGIGLGEWAHPFWRSDSIDNFWLGYAMRYGVPALLFLWTALLVHFLRAAYALPADEDTAAYRIGYLIALVGIVLSLGVVNIWGVANVFVMLYFGAGAWIYDGALRSRRGVWEARLGPRATPSAPSRPVHPVRAGSGGPGRGAPVKARREDPRRAP